MPTGIPWYVFVATFIAFCCSFSLLLVAVLQLRWHLRSRRSRKGTESLPLNEAIRLGNQARRMILDSRRGGYIKPTASTDTNPSTGTEPGSTGKVIPLRTTAGSSSLWVPGVEQVEWDFPVAPLHASNSGVHMRSGKLTAAPGASGEPRGSAGYFDSDGNRLNTVCGDAA